MNTRHQPVSNRRRTDIPDNNPRAFYVIAVLLALTCLTLGLYLVWAVINGNGFASRWRIAVIGSVAQTLIELVQKEVTQ
jgi:hypothetical protein